MPSAYSRRLFTLSNTAPPRSRLRNLVLGFVCAGACFAQLDRGTILGTVLDSSAAVVPSAKVTIQNQGTSATTELLTDGEGNFVAPVLPVGTYRVSVSAQGFKTQVSENLQLRVSDRLRLILTL